MSKVNIGAIFATCDHFEQVSGKPVLASILRAATGVTRTELRYLVRTGRLNMFYECSKDGQRQAAYSRPKAPQEVADVSTEEESTG
jgi:hypothetical protein